MKFCKLTSVVAAVTVSAALGSMPALADDDERAECSIASAFVYQSTDFRLPVIDVYGSGFGENRRPPKVQLAGVDIGAFVVESSDTRVVLAFEPASIAAQELFQAIPGPTNEQGDYAYPTSTQLQLSIKPRGKDQSACTPITIASGLVTSSQSLPGCGEQKIMGGYSAILGFQDYNSPSSPSATSDALDVPVPPA